MTINEVQRILSRDFIVKQQQSNEETEYVTKTKTAAVMSRPPGGASLVSPVQPLCTRDGRTEQRIKPTQRTIQPPGGGSPLNSSHLHMPSVTSQAQASARKPGSHFIL